MENYYKYQLSKVKTDGEYPATVKISSINSDDNGKTNWMDLNKESAQVLVDWLTEKYLNDGKRE